MRAVVVVVTVVVAGVVNVGVAVQFLFVSFKTFKLNLGTRVAFPVAARHSSSALARKRENKTGSGRYRSEARTVCSNPPTCF